MPQQIKKIIVKHVGVLKVFATPNAPRLAQLTTFYGRNGRGKSTLSAIMRSAAEGNAAPLKARTTFGISGAQPEVTFVLETGVVNLVDGKWTPQRTPIDVFDTTFIADNLYAGEAPSLDHDRGLFTIILGSEGVALVKHQEFFNATAKRTGARLKEAENALKEDIPTDMTREEFFASSGNEGLLKQLGQAEKDLKAVQQQSRIAGLQKLEKILVQPLPADMGDVLWNTVDEIETYIRSHLSGHFKKFQLGKRGEAWVKFGLEHIHDDSCPFCGKAGVNDQDMVTVYSKIFGETYKAFFEIIRQTGEAIDNAIGAEALEDIDRKALSNAEAIRSWSEFVDLDQYAPPPLEEALDILERTHERLKGVFDSKRQEPLVPITSDQLLPEIQADMEKALAVLETYNKTIGDASDAIARHRTMKPMTELQARSRVSNLQKRIRRNEPGVQSRIDASLRAHRADQRAKKFRTLVQDRLKDANRVAASHYHARVNFYLAKFGATFSISEISNAMSGNVGSVDYGLIVRGHPVERGRGGVVDGEATFKSSLSTGDKTTLAFAFFLTLLDRHQSLENRIIVFDDPLSSHDSHRKLKTVEVLNGIVRRSRQTIVMSHDAHFLRDVTKRCAGVEKATYQIDFDGENWSKVEEADMDELCQSEFQSQLAVVRAFYERREGSALEVSPFIRRLLESHFRRTYTAYFNSSDMLGEIIGKIKAEGVSHPCWQMLEALEACNETNDEHHGENPRVLRTPIDDDNLHVLAGECLLLVNAVRPKAATDLKTI